jgi:hypothetical protein
LKETLSRCKGQTYDTHGISKAEKLKQASGRISRHDSGRKSRRLRHAYECLGIF